MADWWRGTRLVAERSWTERVRSKAFRIVVAALLLLSVAAVTLPKLLSGGTTTFTLATVGAAPPELVAMLDAAAEAGGLEVDYTTRDEGEMEDAIRNGDVTVGLAGDTMYTSADDDGTFALVVAQAVVAIDTAVALADMGLTPDQVAELESVHPPRQVTVGAVTDEDRVGVGFAVGIVLYMAITLGGTAVATAVATEKSTRISEVLMAVLRPSQIQVGTVLAFGAVTLVELMALAAPLALASSLGDTGLPAVLAGDIVLAIAWFLLGFALYSFLFAATGALVDKITEVSTAITPVTMLLVVFYVLTITVVTDEPDSAASAAVSMFPLTAPMAMPLRWASGEVPGIQLAIALVLTAAAAVALISVSATVYRRALVITGQRVKLRDVLGRRSTTR